MKTLAVIHNPHAVRALSREPKPMLAPLTRNPMRLVPIPWGQPDRPLARAVGQHIADATPPIVIPANPLTSVRVRTWLHTHSIAHV